MQQDKAGKSAAGGTSQTGSSTLQEAKALLPLGNPDMKPAELAKIRYGMCTGPLLSLLISSANSI